jgi:hypothetical protein
MSAAVLSCLIFALTLGGIVLGALLRTTLPQHHLSKDSQDVVRLGVGLIATIAALVLGLLIAAAKGSFDTQSGQVKQITADIILLDALLEQYGPEAQPIRGEMRSVLSPLVDRIWHEKPADATRPFARSTEAESVYVAIQALSPRNCSARCRPGRHRSAPIWRKPACYCSQNPTAPFRRPSSPSWRSGSSSYSRASACSPRST